MIAVIGDSHVSVFTGQPRLIQPLAEAGAVLNPPWAVYHVGSFLAYNAYQEYEALVEFAFIAGCHKVLLSFGELDCRLQIVKRAREPGHTAAGEAATVAERYLEAVDAFRVSSGCETWVLGPPPTRPGGPGEYRTHGSRQECRETVVALDRALRVACPRWSLGYIPVLQALGKVSDADFVDGVHLGPLALPRIAAACATQGLTN